MNSDIREIVNQQKRQRRLMFWAGFAVLALIGSLWAGLSKEDRGPGFFDDVGNEPAFAEPDQVFIEAEIVETTVAVPVPTTTAPEPTVTTVAETVEPLETVPPSEDGDG